VALFAINLKKGIKMKKLLLVLSFMTLCNADRYAGYREHQAFLNRQVTEQQMIDLGYVHPEYSKPIDQNVKHKISEWQNLGYVKQKEDGYAFGEDEPNDYIK
jgi:hypothetical protein